MEKERFHKIQLDQIVPDRYCFAFSNNGTTLYSDLTIPHDEFIVRWNEAFKNWRKKDRGDGRSVLLVPVSWRTRT